MKFQNILILCFLIFLILFYGKFLLVPLFFAIFFYILLNSISDNLIEFALAKNIKINDFLSFVIIFSFFLFFIYFLYTILKMNIFDVIESADIYQNNFNELFSYFNGTPIDKILKEINIFNNLNFVEIFSYFLNSITSFAGNFSMIIIFLIFLVIERNLFRTKIKKVINDKNKIKIFSNISKDIYSYFRIKTLTSFITGFLTFVFLYLNQSNLDIAFGILSFFLNFIPYIGSMLSILLPTIFVSIETLNFFQPMIIFFLLLLTHIFIGNFLENKLMGKALNISPIVLLIFLTLMGKIWGLSGMFLSVPILVVILIVLKNFKQTKKIAILLSEKGNM